MGAAIEARRQASWKAANEKLVAGKRRVLPLKTPDTLSVAYTDPLGNAAARRAQELAQESIGLGGISDTLRESEQNDLIALPQTLRALAAQHVYELSEPVTLVHGSETAIRRFDVDFNLNPLNSVESVTAGPGVYTFRKVGSAYPGDLTERAPKHVYEFTVPAGAKVLDLNDPQVSRLVEEVAKVKNTEYSNRIDGIRQSIRGSNQSLGLSDFDVKRSYAIHDLWIAVGKPDLIIGSPYNESEIVVRNPKLLEGYSTPLVEYPQRNGVERPRSLPVPDQSSSTTP